MLTLWNFCEPVAILILLYLYIALAEKLPEWLFPFECHRRFKVNRKYVIYDERSGRTIYNDYREKKHLKRACFHERYQEIFSYRLGHGIYNKKYNS